MQWDNVTLLITHVCTAVKRGQANDIVAKETDCRPAWNKCQLKNCMERKFV